MPGQPGLHGETSYLGGGGGPGGGKGEGGKGQGEKEKMEGDFRIT